MSGEKKVENFNVKIEKQGKATVIHLDVKFSKEPQHHYVVTIKKNIKVLEFDTHQDKWWECFGKNVKSDI